MSKPKNPYVNSMTLEQVAHAESKFYYIQVGEEVAYYGNKTTFVKEVAENIFMNLLDSLMDMRKNGDKDEQIEAKNGLANLKMHALRIH